jgi:hypothetical protein
MRIQSTTFRQGGRGQGGCSTAAHRTIMPPMKMHTSRSSWQPTAVLWSSFRWCGLQLQHDKEADADDKSCDQTEEWKLQID